MRNVRYLEGIKQMDERKFADTQGVEFQPIENGGTYLWSMAQAPLITRPFDYHSYNSGARSHELML